jgi:FkbM family methyltransferase
MTVGGVLGSARRRAGLVKLRLTAPSAGETRDLLDNRHLRVLLAASLRANSNCVDVGASIGGVLGEMLRVAPEGRHIAFEPIPELARRLEERFPTVDVRQVALSDHSGRERFVHVTSRPAFSGLRERSYPGPQQLEYIEVDVAPLDDLLEPSCVPTLIKIDVEGGELGVLQGATRTVARHRPLVVFEHGAGAADHYGTRPEQVWELLVDELGLRIFDLDGNGPYGEGEFGESFYAGERWNYLARD